ncbi:MAG: MarR family transcriptional regulator [Herbiconiux sp.]|uniref:MarR family winged helix-turn-helix transcriptional regulator n=1 Tax=Herbiconiux sp. TaxID=1871186 RepID=UPI0012157FBC|nr:MarR family transcriptional regulator [Herbiconiux sp.]TAJ49405.1 MAG: MarR family transcriptional regulator [Herbiconiux sp.]
MPQNVVRREARHLYAANPRSDAARAAVEALLSLQNAEEREIERVRKASGLSNNEFHALRYLLQAQREHRDTGPKDLVVMLGISNASVTNIVDHLEQLGDLEREVHPTDRRAQLLHPTPAAAAKIERAYKLFHETVVHSMDSIGAADAEIVARTLDAITERLENIERSENSHENTNTHDDTNTERGSES